MNSQVFFMTGCASGIGRHMAVVLARAGHRLLLTDIDLERLEQEAERQRWPKERVICRKLDVRDAARWEELVAETVETWGRLDVMLNIAGYLLPGYIAETEASDVDRHLDINTKGVIHGTRTAAIQMLKQRFGHIVNIASLAGIAPVPGLSLYCASKFAVRGFSIAVAQELEPRGVSVTVVCPDAVQTPMLDLQLDYEEAALTFSNPNPLTVEDIERALVDDILPNRPLEVILPRSRGWLAKAVNSLPTTAFSIAPLFKKLGLKLQDRMRTKRGW